MKNTGVCLLSMLMAGSAYADKTLDWQVHKDTTTSNAQIDGWHQDGNRRLRKDDDGASAADVACRFKVIRGSISRNWTYARGDSRLDNAAETRIALRAMTGDTAALSSHYSGTPGLAYRGKIIVFGTVDASTVVHEVGHTAGLGHTTEQKRFMTPSNKTPPPGRTRATASDCTSYRRL